MSAWGAEWRRQLATLRAERDVWKTAHDILDKALDDRIQQVFDLKAELAALNELDVRRHNAMASLRAQVKELREHIAWVGVPIEVLTASDAEQPYREIGRDLMAGFVSARDRVRGVIGTPAKSKGFIERFDELVASLNAPTRERCDCGPGTVTCGRRDCIYLRESKR